MNSDNYVKQMTQKYCTVIAVAVLKSKPTDLTIDEYIQKLKNNVENENMDVNFDICSDDFDINEYLFDLEIEKDNDISKTSHLNNLNYQEESNLNKPKELLTQYNNINKPDKTINDSLNILKELNEIELSSNVNENIHITNKDLVEYQLKYTEPNEIIRTNLTENQLIDTQATELYDFAHIFTQNLTHISQSQDEDERFKLLETYVLGTNRVKSNIKNNTGNIVDLDENSLKDTQMSVDGDIEMKITEYKIEKDVNDKGDNIFNTNINNAIVGLNRSVLKHTQMSDGDVEMKITEINETSNLKQAINGFNQNFPKDTQMLLEDEFETNSGTIHEKTKLYENDNIVNIDTDKNVIVCSNLNIPKHTLMVLEDKFEINSYTIENTTDNHEKDKFNDFNNISNLNQAIFDFNRNVPKDTQLSAEKKAFEIISQTNDKITENKQDAIVNLNQNVSKDTQIQNKNKTETNKELNTNDVLNNLTKEIDNHLVESQIIDIIEKVPFAILDRLNRIKGELSKRSSEGYSFDSGYRSDSQNQKVLFNNSDTLLYNAGDSLLKYLLECNITGNTDDIIQEISVVFGEFIDKLHLEEKYPPFIECILDKIKYFINDICTSDSCGLDVISTKNNTITRILLLNNSQNLITYTIEQITTILEQFYKKITEKELYEITNIKEIENISYIFNILEILLQRYVKKEKKATETNLASQKNSITEIWKKKWDPNYLKMPRESVQIECCTQRCGAILKSIILNCMGSYSLISYTALQCFNHIQD